MTQPVQSGERAPDFVVPAVHDESNDLVGGLPREGAAAARPVPGHVLPVLPARAGADGRDIRPPAIARRRFAGHRRHRTGQCAAVLQVQADAHGDRRRSAADDPPLVRRAAAGADAGADADDGQHLHQPDRRAAGAAAGARRRTPRSPRWTAIRTRRPISGNSNRRSRR